MAKSRPPPSDGPGAGGKKHKPSSGRSSRSKQGQGGDADGSHWESDGTSSHDTHGGQSSHPQQQSFVNVDYTPQTGGELALPGYLYHGDYQQNQSRATCVL